ncbi:MAG: sulfatase-like hydrolase/transferase, partial [Clostridia bacterium]|nr:sulfatase-like hydrolase/transferase [Clostridia bacterium]
MERESRKSRELIPSYMLTWLLYILLFEFAELWLRISSTTDTAKFWDVGLFYTFWLTFVFATFWYVFCSLFKTKIRLILLDVVMCFCCLVCIVQAVYFDIFDNFFVIFSIKAIGDAVGTFWKVMFTAIWHQLPLIIITILGVVFWFLFVRKEIAYQAKKSESDNPVFAKMTKNGLIRRAMALVIAFAVYLIILFFLAIGSSEDLKPKYLYFNNTDTVLTVRNFGAVNGLRLDLKFTIFGTKTTSLKDDNKETDINKLTGDTGTTKKGDKKGTTTTEKPVEYNMVDINFDQLIANTSNQDVIDLHEYFKSLSPTKKNDYTGKFKGKNVIQITAEAFYSNVVDKDLTPTLYKMTHEGLEFTNYYSPGWGVSTLDGEYVNTLSMIPKSGVWSMWRTKDNNLYYSLGNACHRLGYTCYAYHNNTYDYYSRDESHDNLWVKWKAVGHGLEFSFNGWPRSDYEMIDITTPDYLGKGNPFAIYYLSCSGHANYNWGGNAMSAKNKDVVANLSYSDEVKAYLACQYELEKAMTLLLQKLEQAGELENTLIIIAADHYPYGLSEASLTEILGPGYSMFDMYKNTLIMYNPTFKHTVIDKPCYSIDILPTALNLMGIDYDSRLLIGSDILSDSQGLVIFSDRSWITNYGVYNSSTGEF